MAVNCPRKTIEDEPGTVGNSLDLMSYPVPSKMEEGDHVPLTYADLKRWLRLLVLMSSLFGLTGAVLAVPAAAMFKIAIEEFYLQQRQLNEDQIAAQAKQIIYDRADS